MNKIEKNKWKRFLKFSGILAIVLFIGFLLVKGFSFETIKQALTYSAILMLFDFFWIFSVRDENG